MIGLLTTGFYRLRKDEINEHLLTWKISLQVLKEKPITGVGIGNFRKAFGDAQTIYFEQGEPTEQEVALAGNPNCPVNDFIHCNRHGNHRDIIVYRPHRFRPVLRIQEHG